MASLYPTRGTYTGALLRVSNCSHYSIKNLDIVEDASKDLYIKNGSSDTPAQSTTIPGFGSDSSLWQNFVNLDYGVFYIDGDTNNVRFTIEMSPGTVVTEV